MASAGGEGTGPSQGRATRLTILCRGATVSSRQPRFFSDERLLAKETERARKLAQHLRAFDEVLHAPEKSAAETAALFSSRPIPCPPLRDVDYGQWNERAIADVAAGSPQAFERWMSDPAAAPHGGESFDAACERAASWLTTLHAKGGSTLAVTHGIILKLLLAHVLGAPLASLWRIDVEPLGMLLLTSDGRRWALRGFGSDLPAVSGL
ncbi:histidine phosphatase family protein [Shinella sp. BYT-45]|uniref:histidine phosphatase family protein n=1 Tax=Shinella sp. BYT-45 TaxID=3377377 RepID=UPI00397EE39A